MQANYLCAKPETHCTEWEEFGKRILLCRTAPLGLRNAGLVQPQAGDPDRLSTQRVFSKKCAC